MTPDWVWDIKKRLDSIEKKLDSLTQKKPIVTAADSHINNAIIEQCSVCGEISPPYGSGLIDWEDKHRHKHAKKHVKRI